MAETLAEIRTLVRDLSNQQNESELSSTTLDGYINNWYQNKLPSEISWGLDRSWRFITIPYRDKYAVTAEHQRLTHGIRINGEDIDFYTDPSTFYALYPDSWENDQTFGEGDGTTTTFAGTIGSGYRIIPESVVAGDTVETFEDNGDGTLTGSEGGSGTIVYNSGALSITFATAPTDGVAIATSFAVYNESQPEAALYYNADTDDAGGPEITLRPIPDSNYSVEIDYEARPTALSDDDDETLKKGWGDLIAYGTAIDILERYGNFAEAQTLKQSYLRIHDSALSQEANVMSKKRPIPRW